MYCEKSITRLLLNSLFHFFFFFLNVEKSGCEELVVCQPVTGSIYLRLVTKFDQPPVTDLFQDFQNSRKARSVTLLSGS